MLTLIRKDLILHKPAFLGYLPIMVVYLAYLASQVSSVNVFITFTSIISAIMPMVLLSREDKFGAEAFICSLPVTRRLVVNAKFVISWGSAFLLAAMGLVLYSLFAGEDRMAVWSFPSIGRVLLFLAVGLGMALPFSLRFGWMGLIVGLVGIQVLGVVTLLIVKTLSPSIRLKDAFNAVSNFLNETHAQLGGPLYLVVAILVASLIGFVSCKVSQAAFARREF